MDVKTLIADLSKLPQDYDVVLEGCDCNNNAVSVTVAVPQHSSGYPPFVIICNEDGPGYYTKIAPPYPAV